MWELDCEESWVPKNWLSTDAKAETPILWPPHANSLHIGKDYDAGRNWGQEEKGMTEDEMAGWHHQLDGRESEWTPGVGDGQGGLACCDSWVTKSRTRLSDWTELNWCHFPLFFLHFQSFCFNIILNIQKNYKNKTKSFSVLFTQNQQQSLTFSVLALWLCFFFTSFLDPFESRFLMSYPISLYVL